MFSSLKNKIKEETGTDIQNLTTKTLNGSRNLRGRLSSSTSIASFDDSQIFEQKNSEINLLRADNIDLTSKFTELSIKYENLQKDKLKIEKENEILSESLKETQSQKNLIYNEQEKIQDVQQEEINKLKSLLSFREQEAVDLLSTIKQNQQEIENLKVEIQRLKPFEAQIDGLQDKLESLRHSFQHDKNNLTTTLAVVEEENRHLKCKLKIYNQTRLEALSTLNSDEKIQTLIQERKLLEQNLEEAHLQLSDIKSFWCGQNLSLETQVNRLSMQVAEETTEKRKAYKERDEYNERIKQLEFELHKNKEEIIQRENKIKLLEEEVDEVTLVLKAVREETEEEIICFQNKVESANKEIKDLKSRLTAADDRFNECINNSDNQIQALQKQNSKLQEEIQIISGFLDNEKQEKLTALLRNAEISQSEELLRKQIRIEHDEINELNDKINENQRQLKIKSEQILLMDKKLIDLNSVINSQRDRNILIEELKNEINEKNKSIKILNQRLIDVKKTFQQEIKNGNIIDTFVSSERGLHDYKNFGNGGPIIMDEVNFKYLKHVIVKFLTSREVEARHLIRAVATLLQLTNEEEKLLHDTLNWKMSWFGTKPDHGNGQKAFSIPPG